jgi:psiF repeat
MLKYVGLLGLPLLLLATPASAISYKQKMETCKFGANDQKLTGTKRNAFIKKCMGKGNYQPAARKDAMKKQAAKPAAMKPDQEKQ